jgi:transposase-like protein
MLRELSMVEQRYQAVREVLDTGATITDVAARYGVDRTTLHHWQMRPARLATIRRSCAYFIHNSPKPKSANEPKLG